MVGIISLIILVLSFPVTILEVVQDADPTTGSAVVLSDAPCYEGTLGPMIDLDEEEKKSPSYKGSQGPMMDLDNQPATKRRTGIQLPGGNIRLGTKQNQQVTTPFNGNQNNPQPDQQFGNTSPGQDNTRFDTDDDNFTSPPSSGRDPVAGTPREPLMRVRLPKGFPFNRDREQTDRSGTFVRFPRGFPFEKNRDKVTEPEEEESRFVAAPRTPQSRTNIGKQAPKTKVPGTKNAKSPLDRIGNRKNKTTKSPIRQKVSQKRSPAKNVMKNQPAGRQGKKQPRGKMGRVQSTSCDEKPYKVIWRVPYRPDKTPGKVSYAAQAPYAGQGYSQYGSENTYGGQGYSQYGNEYGGEYAGQGYSQYGNEYGGQYSGQNYSQYGSEYRNEPSKYAGQGYSQYGSESKSAPKQTELDKTPDYEKSQTELDKTPDYTNSGQTELDKTPDYASSLTVSIVNYNSIINCYNTKISSSACTDTARVQADLDANGVVNYLDYNTFLLRMQQQSSL